MLKKCDAERARKIDLLFLSIGGNDVGFARLVANAVLADKSILRKLGGWFGQVHGFAEASSQLDALDDRLKSVNRALHNLLHVPWSESDRIILTGYPPMALLDDGKIGLPGRPGRHERAARVLAQRGQGARGQRGGRAPQRHHAGERPPASVDVRRWRTAPPSAAAACAPATAMRPGPWRTSCAFRARSTAPGSRSTRRDWRAYAPRQRLFRTPNDAYMTGNFHVAQSLMQKALNKQGYAWVQLLLASVYSGAFHPSAEGQAAIADAVVDKARGVLAKYEKRASARPAASIWASSRSADER